MAERRLPAPRAGKTEKISVSVARAELNELREAAKIHYGGNLSAVIMEGVRRSLEEQGRLRLVAWLGDAAKMTDDEHEALVGEWRAPRRAPAKTARRKKRGA